MIRTDGDRSLKRKWFAKKKLDQIKEMSLPVSTVVWNGFRFNAWQLGDIDGGNVTAPMGAVAACSTRNGIKIAVADYWAGGFNGAQDLYIIFKDLGTYEEDGYIYQSSGSFTTLFNGPIDPENTLEYSTMRFVPTDTYSLFNDSIPEYDFPCNPVIIPERGELFNVLVSSSVDFDRNGNGTFDWFRSIFEKTTSFYISNGIQKSRLSCAIHHVQNDSYNYNPKRIYQKIGDDRYVTFQSTWIYDFVTIGEDQVKYVGVDINIPMSSVGYISLANILTEDIPVALRTILITSQNDGSCEPIGSYAFGTTFFHAVNASTHLYREGGESCEASVYYAVHPEDDKWRLFYSMIVDGVVSIVNSEQFMPLLTSLATETVDTGHWYNAMSMLEQLAGAYPNTNFTVPYDSVMFHGHDGNVYTWTRKYGGVKFSTTGLFAEDLVVPTAVSEENGVRPDITYAGTYNETPLYLCISNAVKIGVRAVHYGSPFTSWTQLPGTPSGYELISARPVLVTPTDIFLIGVVKYTILANEVEVDKYAFASLKWTAATETEEASIAPWNIMGQLPFEVGDSDNLSVGLYGDDALAIALSEYQCPPIVPQSPIGPYAKYAIGMP